jgi:hypothetical protein
MTVGRSWRTYAKHELMNSVVGQEVGVINRPTRLMNKVDRLVWFDLTAGDATPVDGTDWHRGCSPGILAHHAITGQSRKPVTIYLYEIQPATFDRLLNNLSTQLPKLGYEAGGDGKWRHDRQVVIEAFNDSGHTASIDLVDNRDAVLVFNDPNAITEWAMRDTFADELTSRTWCFRTLSTMGCNPAGIKRLALSERLAWFDLIDTQETVLPQYRDLLLAAIERDDAQWAYLLSTSGLADWRKKSESAVASAFRKAGRTAETAWFRASLAEFRATKLRLFLTRVEQDAIRGRERQWLAADREGRLALLAGTTDQRRDDALFPLEDLGESA